MLRSTRSLIPLALFLALVPALLWAPAADAVAYCSSSYCSGKPSTTACGCPPFTDRPGASATCGSWNRVGVCWYGTAAASSEVTAELCPAEPAAAPETAADRRAER